MVWKKVQWTIYYFDRFEEPDEEFIKKYPRIIPDSLRAKDERRKEKRVALKERKQKEKEVKRQEIERLKALKYKEIQAKIEKIKEASGNQDIDLGVCYKWIILYTHYLVCDRDKRNILHYIFYLPV